MVLDGRFDFLVFLLTVLVTTLKSAEAMVIAASNVVVVPFAPVMDGCLRSAGR